LGVQTYSFNRFPFFEAFDKAASVGLRFAEAYPGQKIATDEDGQMGPDMTPPCSAWLAPEASRNRF